MSSTVVDRSLLGNAAPHRMQHAVADSRRVFLCLSSDWDGHPSSLTHIFKIISKTEPVIWVNSIGQRTPKLCWRDVQRVARKLKARGGASNRVTVHGARPQAVIEPRVLPFHFSPLARAINRRLLAAQLTPHLRPWRAAGAEVIAVTTNPVVAYVARALGVDRTIYFCMDEYAEMPECDRDLMRMFEPQLLKQAHRVFATSNALAHAKSNGRSETIYLPQGVDYEHFQNPPPPPAALRDLPRPIIGFQGIVGARVDLALFEKILQRLPQATLVTLGREEVDLARLRRYPHYRHFPAVSYGDLPRWAGAFDIGLIAYKQDGHTAAVNPLKLLEYLAMGQAVMSLELPELVRHASIVTLARDHATYLDALAAMVARYPFSDVECARRRAYAQQHSWAQRAERFLAECDGFGAYEKVKYG